MAAILKESGREVHGVHDGHGAIVAARRLRPEFLFLDLGLPGLDGFQVAETLRREPGLEGMRIIAVTAYGQESDRRRAREAGFDQHLVKPVDMAFVESMLGGAR
jgi:CheY-like chemotaxis protein